jgi:hypothetical protein
VLILVIVDEVSGGKVELSAENRIAKLRLHIVYVFVQKKFFEKPASSSWFGFVGEVSS